jgi:hypothetical protein
LYFLRRFYFGKKRGIFLTQKITSGRRGIGMPEIWGKIDFMP